MKTRNKRILLIGSVLFICICVTFAYFVAQLGDITSSSADIASAVDDFYFDVHDEEEISITLSKYNFGKSDSNQSGTSIASAYLKTNDVDNNATYTYYVYFSIAKNDFVYTSSDSTPEIILQIKDPTGAEVTTETLDDLTYTSVVDNDGNTIKGYDVTTKTGVFNIVSEYEITSTSSTEYTVQNWTFNLIAVNLNSDQTANQGHTFNGEVIIVQNQLFTDAIVAFADDSSNENVVYDDYGNARYIGGEYCYYMEDDSTINYYGSNGGTCATRYDYIYKKTTTYTNQSSCPSDSSTTTYNCTSYIGTVSSSDSTQCTYTAGSTTYTYSISDDGTCSTRYNYTKTTTGSVTNSSSCPSSTSTTTYTCTAYDGTIAGDDPDNYVLFNDELWRIIGVFDVDDGTGTTEKRIKLIRSEPLNTLLSWDYKQSGVGTSTTSWGSNDWTDSQLMMYLNSSVGYNLSTGYTITNGLVKDSNGYIIYQEGCIPASVTTSTSSYSCTSSSFTLTNTAQSQIADAVWYLGGNSTSKITASEFYIAERGITVYSGHATSWTGKVGLMYPSDYGYATAGGSTMDRDTCLGYYLYNWNSYSDCYGNDWLLNSGSVSSLEWFLSPYSGSVFNVFRLYSSGYVSNGNTFVTDVVRPVVYLVSDITISGGTGTFSDPYTIS